MVVATKVRDQVLARFFCGSFDAKNLCAHVVIDPKDMRAVSRETPHAFRANQSRRTCDDDRAHHGYRSTAILAVAPTCILHVVPQFGRQDASQPHRQDACATIPQSSMSLRLRQDSL